MNYAFMSFSCPDLSLESMLALAKRLGYEGIEPRIQSGHKHGLELNTPAGLRARAKEMAAEAGVALCCIATSCKYADPETSEQNKEDTLQAIDLAAGVGAPVIRVFGGKIPEESAKPKAMGRIVEALTSVADHAKERGVTVCMETHDSWCDPSDVAQIMKSVNHPNIAVNWDIMHPVRVGGATMDQAFEALQPWIRHVHFHDGTMPPEMQLCPIGQGAIDHKRAVELLKKDGYTGYLSGEWINWIHYDIHLPSELATMRAYEEEVQ